MRGCTAVGMCGADTRVSLLCVFNLLAGLRSSNLMCVVMVGLEIGGSLNQDDAVPRRQVHKRGSMARDLEEIPDLGLIVKGKLEIPKFLPFGPELLRISTN